MRSFFRALDRHNVNYLLISGQAAVLYGAATFSEDVDIWLCPRSRANFIRALQSVGARVHKLTPFLTARNLRAGHGFHFIIPQQTGQDAYLDVMGRPPRTRPFGKARRRSRLLRTDWGALPVIGIPDLVEIKKTRRLADYDVISRLGMIRLREQGGRVLKWALQNCFRVEDAAELLAEDTKARTAASSCDRRWLRRLSENPRDPVRCQHARQDLAREIADLQQEDVRYWRPILRELRELRRAGALLPDGGSRFT